MQVSNAQKFSPGQVAITAGAHHELEKIFGDSSNRKLETALLAKLTLHVTGEWGNLCDEDKQANEDALATGARILSKYEIQGVDLYFITDAVESGDHERTLTTILRPEDY